MKHLPTAACVSSLFVLASSCLHVGEARTERDATVGIDDRDGMHLVVAEGAAAVRSFEAGSVHLWSNAPELDIDIDPGAHAGWWNVRVDNTLADAVLEGAEAVPSSVPTEHRWRVQLTGKTTLRLRAPDREQLEPWRFLFFADVQDAIDRVQDLYASMNTEAGARFALIGGDLTEGGTRPQLQRFEREMKSLNVPAFATLGNHELFDEDGVPYQELFGRASSHFTFRGVSFSQLDSASSSIDPVVFDWLTGWLADGRDKLHVVTMHIPPLDPIGSRAGCFASKMEAQKLLQRLADAHVDLTLYGHIHSYYGFSNAGIPAFIAGGGGAIPERLDGVGRHYLIVDLDPVAQRLTTTLRRVD